MSQILYGARALLASVWRNSVITSLCMRSSLGLEENFGKSIHDFVTYLKYTCKVPFHIVQLVLFWLLFFSFQALKDARNTAG